MRNVGVRGLMGVGGGGACVESVKKKQVQLIRPVSSTPLTTPTPRWDNSDAPDASQHFCRISLLFEIS